MSINRPALWAMAALIVVTTTLAVPAWRHITERSPQPPAALRLALVLPDDLTLGAGPDHPFGLAVAPDGRRIVFPGSRDGASQLWLRDLTTGDTRALTGTAGGVLPFWSRDGRQLGFFAGGRLRLLALDTGQMMDVAEAPSAQGGAWLANGDIVFAPRDNAGLVRRRASGNVEPLTTIDSNAGESSHRHPVMLRDDGHVLFYVRAAEAARAGVWVAPLDRPAERTRLLSSEASAIAADDWLLWASDDALLAQRLERRSARDSRAAVTLQGEALVVGTAIGRSAHNGLFATGAGDTLVYGSPRAALRELQWRDRQGAVIGTIGSPMEAWDVRIAPRDAGVAVTQIDSQLGTLDIWTYDRDRPLPRRISTSIDIDETPVWSHDGARLAWASGRRTITTRGVLAQLPEIPVGKFESSVRVWDWSADGALLVIGQSRADTREDLMLLTASGGVEPTPYAQTPFNEVQGTISPDGHWIAYASDESGQFEIYVDSFPTAGRRARVTNGGGSEPRWRPSPTSPARTGLIEEDRHTAELFFRRGSELHAVTITVKGELPEAESSSRLFDAGSDIRSYDVSSDASRFVLNAAAPQGRPRPLTVIVNWQSLLSTDDEPARMRRTGGLR